jgi:hypothetical protein
MTGDTKGAAAHRTALKQSWAARICRALMGHADPPGVTAEWMDDERLAINVATSQLDLTVCVARSELAQIERVRSTDGRGLRIGTILEAPAWWCIDREARVLYILGGHDDETWEVGATLPRPTLDAIFAEVAAAAAKG